jgi:Holliday junction DNA helicase RuvA
MEDSRQVMIGFLEGKLRAKSPEYVIVDVHGVGYHVHVPLSTFYDLPELGQPVGLNIHTYVREDVIQLYGFRTIAEKEMFLLLTGINGVGPKLAVGILSGISPDELRQVVILQDYLRLKNIPGVGKKIADRVMLELRDKVQGKTKERTGPARPFMEAGNAFADAFSALVNLGYRPAEAEKALKRVLEALGENPSLEDLLKGALKALA